MERLTEKHYLGTDHYMKCSGSCNVDMDCIDCPSFDCLVERLAAYEDTGLTPERCAEFARADAEGRYIVMRDAEQEGVARLRELAEADKDGRLVVLPFSDADDVEMQRDGITYKSDHWNILLTAFADNYLTLSGRKLAVFSVNEAEKALEAMKNE